MKLIKNIASLSLLQIANYILPFVTVPYLTKILGPDNFGKISFIYAVINYFVLFTDYGFNMSATQQVAMNRTDKQKLSQIFWTTTITKLILAFVSLLILIFLLQVSNQMSRDKLLYLIGFTLVLQSCCSPVWLLQGIEKSEWILPLSVFPKIIILPALFIWVKSKEDYTQTMFIQCVLNFIFTFISCIIILKFKKLINWYKPDISDIRNSLKEGWHLFISTAAISVYTTSNTVLLGLVANNAAVGYFSAADRLIKGVHALLFTMGQAAYPRINHYITESKEKAIAFLHNCYKWIGGISLFVSLALFFSAKLLVSIVFGLDQYAPSVTIIRILSFTPFIVCLSYVFGILGLLSFGYKKIYLKVYLIAAALSVCITLPLVYLFSIKGIASSIVITELFITLLMFVYLRSKGVFSLNGPGNYLIKKENVNII